jgi:hypothetical protein
MRQFELACTIHLCQREREREREACEIQDCCIRVGVAKNL